ncbi:MAG: membrane protein insertase YidC [Bacteroidaceae bacterium]|nr:membrane protein insertase YidC [Bacteroidaceae bacterium]
MDKNTLIGFALIGLVLIGFSIYNRPSEEEMARIQRYQDSIQQVMQEQSAIEAARLAEEEALRQTLPDSASALFSAAQGEESFVTLKNNLVELQLSTKGGRVSKATLAEYKGKDGNPVVLFDGEEEMRMNFAFSGKNENILTENLYFQPLNASDSTVTMRLNVGEGRHIDFNYFLPADLYLANLTITAEGMQNFFTPSTKTMDFNWYQRTRQQEKGYSFEQQFSSLTYRVMSEDTEHLNEQGEDKEEVAEAIDWIAFKNQFFSSAVIAEQDFNKTSLSSVPQKEGSGYLKKYNAESQAFFDPTGKESTNFQLYFGPNHFKTLQATNDYVLGEDKDPELEDLVYLGWPIIRWINRWFTINVFDWLSGWGLNMGIVILLMTIIVKIVVYPTTYKSYMSSAKMRVLRPYVDEINKKYPNPDDALKKNQETMALYSRYGVSPMGGCLPMLIQMPVYIALFNFVPNAIELRGESFLWADDLSTYDDVINWGTDIWLLGDHLSLFCLLFSVTNILNTWYMMRQQKDTMAGQQQMPGMKVMMYAMPVMFIFFFNSYSAGLNYYYFISGLIGILIMLVLRKTTDDKALLAKLEARMEANKNKPRKMTGMAAKLEALQKQLEEQQRLQQQQQQNRNNKR